MTRRAAAVVLAGWALLALAAAPASARAPKPVADLARVERLMAAMTLDEKVGMVHGQPDITCRATRVGCVGQGGYVIGVPRLGIPELRLGDGPAGLHLDREQTAMPAPVSLAATFDPDAATAYGGVLGREARATNMDVVLAPMVNLVRVPIAGRNFETLGEDPLLAAALARAEVEGIQAEGAMASVKHFASNVFEQKRKSTNVEVDERALHEMEFAPFEAAVEGGVASVMCAYTRVNGRYACSSGDLMRDVLKGLWGFRGFVRSDGGATHQMADLVAGLDMEIRRGKYFSGLPAAVATGTPAIPGDERLPGVPAIPPETWAAALDGAVRRILGEMDRFGLLDGSAGARPSMDAVRARDVRTAEGLAVDGATLLRNRDGALPLRPRQLERRGVVVMGPTAVATLTGGGGSSHVIPFAGVQSPLDALRAAAGRRARIDYVPGYDLDGELVPAASLAPPPELGSAAPGLVRQQITTASARSDTAPPEPQPGGAPDAVDAGVDYSGSTVLPGRSGWRWTGTLTPPGPGRYQLTVQVSRRAAARLWVDGRLRAQIKPWAFDVDGLAQDQRTHGLTPALLQANAVVDFAAGQSRRIEIRAAATSATPLQVRLAWSPPDFAQRRIDEAVAAARRASAAVVFAYEESREGFDRPSLALPGAQDRLIEAVAAANPQTIVVLNSGGPVRMPWLRRVAAVLEMWYPGQRGGRATSRILLGRTSPGGKLPVTFPTDLRRQPAYSRNGSRYPGILRPPAPYRTVSQSEGLFTGYRWYERTGVRPLFPFGHGLSYSTFRYGDLRVTPRGDGFRVRFRVRNTGKVAADEVAQVYVGRPRESPVAVPRRVLAGFRRVHLAPGRTARVTVDIAGRTLSYWSSARDEWMLMRRPRAISVGSSSADLRLFGRTAPGAAPPATPE